MLKLSQTLFKDSETTVCEVSNFFVVAAVNQFAAFTLKLGYHVNIYKFLLFIYMYAFIFARNPLPKTPNVSTLDPENRIEAYAWCHHHYFKKNPQKLGESTRQLRNFLHPKLPITRERDHKSHPTFFSLVYYPPKFTWVSIAFYKSGAEFHLMGTLCRVKRTRIRKPIQNQIGWPISSPKPEKN